jgi:ubiquinol-cytochrome c reductase iron-sulfur subunit
VNRRTVLTRIVQAFSLTGFAFLTYPFIRAFVPSFEEDLSLEIDLSGLSVNHSKTISWLGRNLYIVRRSDKVSNRLFQESEQLKDPASRDSVQPDFARNPWRSKHPDIFVVFKNCTHLGCEVAAQTSATSSGFSCPCHNSQFDSSGRVEKDSVASFNLEVPDYEYVSRDVIRLIKTS